MPRDAQIMSGRVDRYTRTIRKMQVAVFPYGPDTINRGECAEWALAVREIFPEAELYFYHGDAGHAFVRLGGKWRDAHAPEGVNDWRRLRVIAEYRKGSDPQEPEKMSLPAFEEMLDEGWPDEWREKVRRAMAKR